MFELCLLALAIIIIGMLFVGLAQLAGFIR